MMKKRWMANAGRIWRESGRVFQGSGNECTRLRNREREGKAYRSLREIPSFFIIAFRVVRGTPNRVAAALITPPVSRKTRRM